MNALHYFTTLPQADYDYLLLLVASAVVISVLLEVLKRNLGWSDNKIIVSSLGLMSFTVSLAGSYLNVVAISPKILGADTLYLTAVATLVYHLGGSSSYKKAVQFLNDLNGYLTDGSLPGGTKPKS